MIIRYRTGSYGGDIQRVEVERETEHFVWIKGRREGRWTRYDKYHDTWHSAYAYLLNKAIMSLENSKDRLERAIDYFGKILAMTDPDVLG